jgi:LuxR family maltose regulon positive regulatory protein
LRCTREETKAFFDISKKTSLTDESIRVIHRKTEGWITGLQLVLLSLTGTTDHEGRIRAFSASDRLVTDYLMEQVIASQPPEIKEILALTSVPERFNSELCEELLAGSGRVSAESSRELFARLYQENLFVVPLDSSHSWYRYHHLFRQFLLERFAKLTSQSQEGILKRAGHWFSANGWVEDALTCLLATGEVDAAEDLIGSHLHDVLASDLSRRTLIRWLDPFPPGEERERIPLLVAWSYIRTLHSDYGGVERLLDMVDAVGSSTPGGRQQRWLAKFRFDLEFLRGITSFWGGDVEKACEFTSMVVDRQSEASGFAKMMSILYYGGSLALTGREAEYVSFVQHTGRELGPAYDPQRLPFMTVEAIVHLYRGELAECRAVALRFTTNTGLSIPKYFEVVGYFLLGVTAYEQNQLDEAQRHFLNVESRRFEAPAFFEQGAASGLAQIELVRGDIDAAERHAATARSIAVKAESSFLLRCSEAVDCHLAVATGKQLDDTTPPPAGFDFVYLSIIQPSQCWAWAQVHNPSGAAREAALELVETALHRAETHGVTRRAIQLSALRALTLDTLGRRVEAVTALEAAVRRATALGFVRSFVDLGEGICTLLHALAERHPGDTQVATLLEAFESGPLRDSRTTGTGAGSTQRATRSAEDRSPDTTAHVYGAACDNLTNRELDVLELLQQRLTNKEIAIRLDIAAATVKMHTLGIYRKLGVSGRRQAVAVAIDRGILTG